MEPQFPLTLAWTNGEVETVADTAELLCDLEEFDSSDPADRAEASIFDASGHPVGVRVKIWTGTCDTWCEAIPDDGG